MELNEMPINPTAETSAPSGSPAAPAPASAGTEGAAVNPFKLPPEIANIKAVQLVSIGAPPAVRINAGEHYPELDPAIDNLDKIIEGGLDVYKTLKEGFVFYNPLFIRPEELQYLDQNGQLDQVVPDYGEVTGSEPAELSDDEVAAFVDRGDGLAQKFGETLGIGQGQQEAPATQAVGTPTPVPQPSPSTQRAVINQQEQAVKAYGGAPTSGPVPGGGRLLNALLKPVQ